MKAATDAATPLLAFICGTPAPVNGRREEVVWLTKYPLLAAYVYMDPGGAVTPATVRVVNACWVMVVEGLSLVVSISMEMTSVVHID